MLEVNAALARLGGFAPTVLRVVVGGLMTYHGFDKFRGGLAGTEMMFTMLDAPAPAVTAPLVAVVELVGGIALILGLATRLAAVALGAVLVGALVLVKIDVGVIASRGSMPGAELDLALMAALLAVFLLGPGQLAADRPLGLDRTTVTAAA